MYDFICGKFILVLDWFEEDKKPYEVEPSRVYICDCAREAIEMAASINTCVEYYEEHGSPKNMYLYFVEDGSYYSEARQFLCSWMDLSRGGVCLRQRHGLNLEEGKNEDKSPKYVFHNLSPYDPARDEFYNSWVKKDK